MNLGVFGGHFSFLQIFQFFFYLFHVFLAFFKSFSIPPFSNFDTFPLIEPVIFVIQRFTPQHKIMNAFLDPGVLTNLCSSFMQMLIVDGFKILNIAYRQEILGDTTATLRLHVRICSSIFLLFNYGFGYQRVSSVKVNSTVQKKLQIIRVFDLFTRFFRCFFVVIQIFGIFSVVLDCLISEIFAQCYRFPFIVTGAA